MVIGLLAVAMSSVYCIVSRSVRCLRFELSTYGAAFKCFWHWHWPVWHSGLTESRWASTECWLLFYSSISYSEDWWIRPRLFRLPFVKWSRKTFSEKFMIQNTSIRLTTHLFNTAYS